MEVLDIPANMVGKLIGRGGETIRNLQQSSDTRIQVDHSGDGDNKRVTISGMSRYVGGNWTCMEPARSLGGPSRASSGPGPRASGPPRAVMQAWACGGGRIRQRLATHHPCALLQRRCGQGQA
jgi:hypothetical protein